MNDVVESVKLDCLLCPYCNFRIAVLDYRYHIGQCRSTNPTENCHSLVVERHLFETRRDEWCNKHLGRFVLIRGKFVRDFYDTHSEAYSEGMRIWGSSSFLIREIRQVDKAVFVQDRVTVCFPKNSITVKGGEQVV